MYFIFSALPKLPFKKQLVSATCVLNLRREGSCVYLENKALSVSPFLNLCHIKGYFMDYRESPGTSKFHFSHFKAAKHPSVCSLLPPTTITISSTTTVTSHISAKTQPSLPSNAFLPINGTLSWSNSTTHTTTYSSALSLSASIKITKSPLSTSPLKSYIWWIRGLFCLMTANTKNSNSKLNGVQLDHSLSWGWQYPDSMSSSFLLTLNHMKNWERVKYATFVVAGHGDLDSGRILHNPIIFKVYRENFSSLL